MAYFQPPASVMRILPPQARVSRRLGAINVQGEEVEKLDTWSDNVFIDTFSERGPVCMLISEEMEEPRHFKAQCARYSYAVLYDVKGTLGTIFAVRRRKPGHGDGIEDVLAACSEQIAAGYGKTAQRASRTARSEEIL